jgi:hypothetical protein
MMLSKALQSKTETARKVLIETFGQVHAALEDSSLSDRGALRELDRAMPDPKSGNRAKRLRKALIKNMERTDWSREEFERAVAPAGSQAKSLTKLVEKKHPLRRFLESAFDELTAPLRG